MKHGIVQVGCHDLPMWTMSMGCWNVAGAPWSLKWRSWYCQWLLAVLNDVLCLAKWYLSIPLCEVQGEDEAGPL